MRGRRAVARLTWALALAAALFVVDSTAPARFASPAWAQDSSSFAEPEIARPVGYVNDRAGVLQESTKAQLEAFLDQVHQKTGAEFAVLVVRSTAPLTPSEYKVKVFETWGIGKKGEDNGLLLLLAIEEREAWFETGYGLEGILPDGLEARIVREEMSPRFRAGDYDGCVVEGAKAAAARIAADKGVTLEWNGQELRYGGNRVTRRTRSTILTFVIWMIILILLNVMRSQRGGRRRRGYWGPYIGGPWGGMGGWGGGFGGGGFGGGGFGGGGGSFGGFGGGASGGGGGGGRL
jgi:uncharacterized protein